MTSPEQPRDDVQDLDDGGLEVVIEPDVEPRGTVDLASLDAAAGAPAPRVEVHADGRVTPRSDDESKTAIERREVAAALAAAAADPVPDRPASAGTPVPPPTAVDAPRPLAPLGPPEPELALVDGGLGASWEVTRLIAWLLVCTLAVGGLALWLGDLWPWAAPAVATAPAAEAHGRVPLEAAGASAVLPVATPAPPAPAGDATPPPPTEAPAPEIDDGADPEAAASAAEDADAQPAERASDASQEAEDPPAAVEAEQALGPPEAEATEPEATEPEATEPEAAEATEPAAESDGADPEVAAAEAVGAESTAGRDESAAAAEAEGAEPEVATAEADGGEPEVATAETDEGEPEVATAETDGGVPPPGPVADGSRLTPVEDDPAKLEAMRTAAADQVAREDFEGAAETLGALVDAVPEDGESRFRLALVLERLDRADEAAEHYAQAAVAAPEDPRPLNNLALHHLARGERETAREHLDRALALDPEEPDVLTNMANVMVEDAPDQAHPLYDKVLSSHPAHGAARLGRALARERLGDLGGASQDYEALSEAAQADHRAAAKAGLGRLAHRDGRPGEAVPLLRESLSLVDDPATRVSLGAALLAAGDADGARRVVADALRARPEDALAWRTLAVALARLGRDRPHLLEKAKDAYRQAIRLDPNQWTAYYNYALLAEEMRSFPVAIHLYERAIRIDGRAWRAHANLARLYGDAGRWDRALAILDDALAASPDVADVHLQRAYVLGRLDRGMDARAALRRFTVLAAPDDPRLEEIRARLDGHDPGS